MSGGTRGRQPLRSQVFFPVESITCTVLLAWPLLTWNWRRNLCRHHSNAFRPRGPTEPARSADPGARPPYQTNLIPFSDSSIFFSLRIHQFPGIPLPAPALPAEIGKRVAPPGSAVILLLHLGLEEGWVRGGIPGC